MSEQTLAERFLHLEGEALLAAHPDKPETLGALAREIGRMGDFRESALVNDVVEPTVGLG